MGTKGNVKNTRSHLKFHRCVKVSTEKYLMPFDLRSPPSERKHCCKYFSGGGVSNPHPQWVVMVNDTLLTAGDDTGFEYCC